MTDRYDVIVVGVGGMGSATVRHLAARGLDVLGLERFDIPHEKGASHGVTRIIRRAQFEHPAYVPLVDRAYELWRDLEAESGRALLHATGGIDAGPADGEVFHGAKASCEAHDIPFETLTGAEVNDRFPGYDLPDDHRAIYQSEGGFVVPEQCIIAHVEAAQQDGATVRAREAVETIEDLGPDGVRVATSKDTYEAGTAVVTAGAWARELLPGLVDLAVPERQVLAWLQPEDRAAFDRDRFPVFIHETDGGEHWYGFPEYDVPGFKFGLFNHREETGTPAEMMREPDREDEALLRDYAETYFPSGAGPTMRLATCMFTNTPDEHFILDHHPDHENVVVGAGFSGHGFKFASAIGEVLADLAVDGETTHDIELFDLDRFGLA